MILEKQSGAVPKFNIPFFKVIEQWAEISSLTQRITNFATCDRHSSFPIAPEDRDWRPAARAFHCWKRAHSWARRRCPWLGVGLGPHVFVVQVHVNQQTKAAVAFT